MKRSTEITTLFLDIGGVLPLNEEVLCLKGVVLGVALTLAVALIGAYFLVRSGLIPANADAKPGRLETWMARTSLDATLRRDAPKGQNPVALTEQNLLNGVHLFAQNCAVCHGSAKGTASSSPIAKGLYQEPPQLATDGVEDDPEGVSFWKIKHGIRLDGHAFASGTPSVTGRSGHLHSF